MSPWLFCCTAYCSHSAKNSRTKYFYLSSLLTMRFFDWDVSVGFHEASFLKAILQVCYLGDKNLWSTWCGKAKNWWWLPAKSHQRKKNMSVQENEYFFRLHAFFKIFWFISGCRDYSMSYDFGIYDDKWSSGSSKLFHIQALFRVVQILKNNII